MGFKKELFEQILQEKTFHRGWAGFWMSPAGKLYQTNSDDVMKDNTHSAFIYENMGLFGDRPFILKRRLLTQKDEDEVLQNHFIKKGWIKIRDWPKYNILNFEANIWDQRTKDAIFDFMSDDFNSYKNAKIEVGILSRNTIDTYNFNQFKEVLFENNKAINKNKKLNEKVNINSQVVKHFDNLPLNVAYAKARKYFESHLMGKTFRAKDGRNIALTERGFREFFFSVEEALRGGEKAAAKIFAARDYKEEDYADVLAVVTSLDKIIQDMEFETTRRNLKPDRKPDIKKYDTYDCEVDLDGDVQSCKIRVEVPFKGDNKYYFHYLD